MIQSDFLWYWNNVKMEPTYRGKNLPDYFFGGFRSTLKLGLKQSGALSWVLRDQSGAQHPLCPVIKLGLRNARKKERKGQFLEH